MLRWLAELIGYFGKGIFGWYQNRRGGIRGHMKVTKPTPLNTRIAARGPSCNWTLCGKDVNIVAASIVHDIYIKSQTSVGLWCTPLHHARLRNKNYYVLSKLLWSLRAEGLRSANCVKQRDFCGSSSTFIFAKSPSALLLYLERCVTFYTVCETRSSKRQMLVVSSLSFSHNTCFAVKAASDAFSHRPLASCARLNGVQCR